MTMDLPAPFGQSRGAVEAWVEGFTVTSVKVNKLDQEMTIAALQKLVDRDQW